MLKKTITFEDLDGNKITEDFYFNLSKAEIAEMEMSQDGGLSDYLEKIVKENDGKRLIEMFKELITKSVGKRSEDGRRFIKTQDIVDDFVQTNAYSELFVELASDAGQAAAFVTGIVPSSMQQAVQDANKSETVELPAASDPTSVAVEPSEPSWIKEGRAPTPDEVRDATPEQLRLAYSRKLSTETPSA